MNKTLVLSALLLAGLNASCAEGSHYQGRQEVGRVDDPSLGCQGGEKSESAAISKLVHKLGKTTSADSGQEISIELASAYEKNPCQFLKVTLSSGLSSEQIAEVVIALPLDMVDRSCDRMNRLHLRSLAISELKNDLPSIARIKDAIREAEDREARACSGVDVGKGS